MLEIQHKRFECIGCSCCVDVAPQYWCIDEDGLVSLVQPIREQGPFTFAIGFPEDEELLREVAASCPMDIIQLLER